MSKQEHEIFMKNQLDEFMKTVKAPGVEKDLFSESWTFDEAIEYAKDTIEWGTVLLNALNGMAETA